MYFDFVFSKWYFGMFEKQRILGKEKHLFIYKMKHEEIFTILIIYLFIQMYYNVSTVHISSHAMMF